MDNIIKEVENLKQIILSSDEYNNYKKSEEVLDKNTEIKNIIEKMKELQKIIINKEDKNEDYEKEEIEVQSLYKKLNSYEDYKNYIESSKIFNDSLTYIQKEFENYFNQFII